MADELIARFRRWFEYEQDAHAKVLSSLDTVPADRRTGPEYRKAVSLFAHVVAGRRMWLGRLGVLPPAAGFLPSATLRSFHGIFQERSNLITKTIRPRHESLASRTASENET